MTIPTSHPCHALATKRADMSGNRSNRAPTALFDSAGRMRRSDPALVLVSAYSTVLGVATEVEVLRAVGIEPTLRSTVARRRELLAFLHSALVAPT